jgi:hypothetical protein
MEQNMKDGHEIPHFHNDSWVWASGLGSIITGLAYLTTTPLFYPMFDPLERQPRQIFLASFLSAGLSVLAAGFLLLFLIRYLREGQRWAWIIAMGTTLYTTSHGIIAIATSSSNVICYLSLIAGLIGLIPLLLSRRTFFRGRSAKKTH